MSYSDSSLHKVTHSIKNLGSKTRRINYKRSLHSNDLPGELVSSLNKAPVSFLSSHTPPTTSSPSTDMHVASNTMTSLKIQV